MPYREVLWEASCASDVTRLLALLDEYERLGKARAPIAAVSNSANASTPNATSTLLSLAWWSLVTIFVDSGSSGSNPMVAMAIRSPLVVLEMAWLSELKYPIPV